MCGICGFRGNIPASALPAMCAAIEHRGPDDVGEFYDKDAGLALGHRRLSIIDLTPAGRQPMQNEDGSVTITFNGEIYGYPKLRSYLEGRGHRFRSRTDTECLIHLYEEHGKDFLKEINGMFALAIWDRARNQLILARDRTGIKPIYYVRNERYFAFASEIKSLLSANLAQRRANLCVLAQYLAFQYVSAPLTAFEGVLKLPAGHSLIVNKDLMVVIEPYWKYGTALSEGSRSEEDYAAELRLLLQKSIAEQMVADVPVGAFLSGGIDSSVVVSEMARISGENVKTFTISYSGRSAANEGEPANLASTFAQVEHTMVGCSDDDARELLPVIIYHMDEPIAEPLMAPTFLLSAAARREVKVAMTGEGADELFLGYDRYKLGYYADLLSKFPDSVLRGVYRVLGRLVGPQDVKCRVIRSAIEKDGVFDWSVVFRNREIAALGRFSCNGDNVHASLLDSHEPRSIAEFLVDEDFSLRLPNFILMRVDKMSMAHGLEVRPPFLDNRILDFALKLPLDMKIRGTIGKYILRRACDGTLPDEIVWRKKKPFSAPYERTVLRLANQFLANSECADAGIISRLELDKLLRGDSFYRGRINEKIWSLIVLEIWYRIFISQSMRINDSPISGRRGQPSRSVGMGS